MLPERRASKKSPSDAFDHLLRLALDLGADEAKVIATDDVVVEDRVVLKCRYGCHLYGKKLICPPFVPSPDEFRATLKEYRYALLAKFTASASADADVVESLLKNEICPDTPPELRERTKRFWSDWDKDKVRVHKAVLELEKAAFNSGYTLAMAFTAGSCALCGECNVGGLCVHPTMKRLPEHALGVNVVKTVRNAGMSLNFPFKKRPNLIAMLLID